jgi:hypothetical protein
MHRKETLIATLWDLRSEYEEGLRALTGAQRALQSWEPGESVHEDRRALKRMHDCFATLSRDNHSVSVTLKGAMASLEHWSRDLSQAR